VNRQFGTTFIIITHDRRIAEQTDRIVEIKDGRIVMDSSR
jgi:lipoprotein-releasing system ATP-binding protein